MSTAAEVDQGQSATRKLGAIILGASRFPHFPSSRHLDNPSFARSAAAFRRLIADDQISIFGRPAILDLFDAGDGPIALIRQVKAFLKSEPGLTDVLFYYCGHGDFLPDRTYYLTLRETEPENEAFTGLPLRQMKLALETQLMMKRVYLVFDCCFSGQAAREWMSGGIGHVIEEQLFQAFPRRGTALVTASARGVPALAPEGEALTMFTGSLVNTIAAGVAGAKRELSFRDVVDAVRTKISERYGSAAVAPEIHAPQQDEGDVTFAPFFINRAFAQAETKAERETFELAVADLERPLSKTREAAVELLAELLSKAQAPAFRSEILEKLRRVQQEDDSQRVRAKCAGILAMLASAAATPSAKPAGNEDRGKAGGGGSENRKAKIAIRVTAAAAGVTAAFVALLVLNNQSRAPDDQGWLTKLIAFFYAPMPPILPLPQAVQPQPPPVLPQAPKATVSPGPLPQTKRAQQSLANAAAAEAGGCEGQKGNVIFEDRFTDDTGGWPFGEENGLSLAAPGAVLSAAAAEGGRARLALNETFSANEGEFCAVALLPQNALQLDLAAGVAFLALDYSNYWMAEATASGKAGLYRQVKGNWSTIWSEEIKGGAKPGPQEPISVRAIVKDGTITVAVNGHTVKSVRAQIPGGDLKFGIFAEYHIASAQPVPVTFRFYKVTENVR